VDFTDNANYDDFMYICKWPISHVNCIRIVHGLSEMILFQVEMIARDRA
jgi:hypothetical protein